jgi:hypothetical protein
VWLSVALAAMATGLVLHHDYPTLYVWAGVTALVCLAPLVHVWTARVAETVPRLLGGLRPVLRSRRLGQVLVAQGVLTVEQLRQLLDLQATSDAAWMRLGDLAVAEGMITRAELAAGLLAAKPSRRHRSAELSGAGVTAA